MKKFFSFVILAHALCVFAQTTDEEIVQSIFSDALQDRTAYEQLRRLCKEAPGRLSGTTEIEIALDLTAKFLSDAGCDTVFYQPVMAPDWNQGEKEICYIENAKGEQRDLSVCALGFSIGTGDKGISAEVIEVSSFDDLESQNTKDVEGKIVFFNQRFNNAMYNTFDGYSDAAAVRVYGASEAAKKGAVAAVIRSATHALDDFPHTGVMRYNDGIPQIPAVCISTIDADYLSSYLKKEPGDLQMFLRTTCHNQPMKESFNVIGELRGSEKPDEIIVIGGHIDTWFNGEGAHDDGAGCIQSIEVIRLFNTLGIQPKRTIRAVMFMDEEMSQAGGKAYAARAAKLNEKHIVAIESDRGAFTPLGFTIDADSSTISKIQSLKLPLQQYGVHVFEPGYGGVDIQPLKKQGVPLIGFLPDWHRYFNYHHAASDVFEAVDIRELQLGSATIASLVYMIDTYGL